MSTNFGIVCALLCSLALAGSATLAPAQSPPSVAAVRSRQVDLATVAGDKTVVRRDATIRRVDANTRNATLRSDEYIVARWAAREVEIAPTVSPRSKAWSVGFGFIGIAADGRELRFRPVIESSGGLVVSKDARAFRGLIYVGLRDNRDPASSYKLPQAVSLLVSGEADDVAPRQLSIDHTNLPFAEVAIETSNPPDEIGFSLIAAGTSERATVTLPVSRPHLEISVARGRIQGLGLESTALTVRAVGLASPEGRAVTLTSDFASIEPTEVRLNDQGTASASVRSVSIGSAAIRASSPPLSPASEPVTFSWPIAFFLASIAGGVSGATLARVQKSGLPKKRSLQTVVIRGVLTGVIVVALYAIGVNVLPIKPAANAGEVLAFAVAAVGGFVGLKFS